MLRELHSANVCAKAHGPVWMEGKDELLEGEASYTLNRQVVTVLIDQLAGWLLSAWVGGVGALAGNAVAATPGIPWSARCVRPS